MNDCETRRFTCTACGKCCDRGPEMELGEATDLAATFVTSLIFKAHSIPLNERLEGAADWWRAQGSRVPLRAALAEKRRHLAQFAIRRRPQPQNGREIYLTISAIVDDYGDGRCPALIGNQCGIYDRRPITCRTVPLHYSRSASVLKSYIDRFSATPGYQCDTTSGPVILRGNNVVSQDIANFRTLAAVIAKADRKWKQQILSLMDDPETAKLADLPTYDAVLQNTNNGYATLVPMIVGWRVAERGGLISSRDFQQLCEKQVALIEHEISRSSAACVLSELLPLYQAGATGSGKPGAAVMRGEARGGMI